MFDIFMKDKIAIIKNDGRTYNDVSADVQEDVIFLNNITIPVEKGDIIKRMIPSGICEQYTVENPVYYSGIQGFPGHYEIKISRI